MNKTINNQNTNNFKSNIFDWKLVQADMADKLGSEVYESWLKKFHLLKNIIIIYYFLYQQDLLETG